MTRILVVDDEYNICSTIEAVLDRPEYTVEKTYNGETGLTLMRRNPPDILLTDLRMDGMSGLDLLAKSREYFPETTVVVMTAFGTIDSAISAIKGGAYEYLIKPFTPDQLEHLIKRILDYRHLKEENHQLRSQVGVLTEQPTITSKNLKMQKILETAKKVATTDSTILITGESGTGKTLLAKIVHDVSVRSKGPFSVVSCAALSENLLESELFGHVRGAFTGAFKDKTGRLQAADGGTVFLDEIGEVSAGLQLKLLRFLQEREFERVGDTRTIRVDVRIVAATNKDLCREVREGRFREDLYFRLNVIDLHMPSLRDRPEDLLGLAENLLIHAFASSGRKNRPLNEATQKAILNYPWPGNIRELKNAMERASILCTGDQVLVEDLPDRVIENSHTLKLGSQTSKALIQSGASLEDLEKQHIRDVLATTSTLEEAAHILGINLSTLWRKRRLYCID